jgi:CRISPR-associated exonuclease Cas4
MPSFPLTALQHLLFCERQCALIHLERVWAENRFTAEGRVLHDKAHDGPGEIRDGVRIARGLPLRSEGLGLHGVADVVEFHRQNSERGETVVPVEYKRGKPKRDDSDRVQLCAQALCLEEMLGIEIRIGALYYGQRRRRTEIVFDEALREITRAAAARLRTLIESGLTPPAARETKCDSCSLLDLCLPGALRFQRGAAAWNDRQFSAILAPGP